jgi:hypothetical protein
MIIEAFASSAPVTDDERVALTKRGCGPSAVCKLLRLPMIGRTLNLEACGILPIESLDARRDWSRGGSGGGAQRAIQSICAGSK